MPGRKPPPPDQLRGFFEEHLLYEVEMMFSLASYLSNGVITVAVIDLPDPDWSRMIRNASLEAFVLHSRVVLEFLYSKAPPPDKPNDAVASDYAPRWTPPSKTKALALIKGRVGSEVAHLTYGRLTIPAEAKGWPFVEIYYDMGGVMHEFLDHVPDELVGANVKQRARALLPHREGPRSGTGSCLRTVGATQAADTLPHPLETSTD